jgi:hypothetical protein
LSGLDTNGDGKHEVIENLQGVLAKCDQAGVGMPITDRRL